MCVVPFSTRCASAAAIERARERRVARRLLRLHRVARSRPASARARRAPAGRARSARPPLDGGGFERNSWPAVLDADRLALDHLVRREILQRQRASARAARARRSLARARPCRALTRPPRASRSSVVAELRDREPLARRERRPSRRTSRRPPASGAAARRGSGAGTPAPASARSPRAPARAAGATSSAHGIRPQRRCAASRPSAVPGTATAAAPGPEQLLRVAVEVDRQLQQLAAAAAARGTATKKSSTVVSPLAASCTSMKPPPPGPVSGLSHTHDTNAAATHASTARPARLEHARARLRGQRMPGCDRSFHRSLERNPAPNPANLKFRCTSDRDEGQDMNCDARPDPRPDRPPRHRRCRPASARPPRRRRDAPAPRARGSRRHSTRSRPPTPNWLWLAGLGFVVSVVAAAGSWRCAIGLCGGRLSVTDACARYGAGSLVNTFVPFRAGDAVRIGLFARVLPNRERLWTTGGAFAALGAARAVVLGALVVAGAAAGVVPLWPLLVAVGLVAIAVAVARRRAAGRRVATSSTPSARSAASRAGAAPPRRLDRPLHRRPPRRRDRRRAPRSASTTRSPRRS